MATKPNFEEIPNPDHRLVSAKIKYWSLSN